MVAENKLGIKIKELRIKLGYTQAQLAELTNIDDKHLSKIESGKHFPTYKTLKKLSDILNFNLQDADEHIENKFIISNNSAYLKSLKILNGAKTDKELTNYYEVLKLANRLMNK